MNIVDTHIHFWDPNHLRYSWLENLPRINKPFLPDDLLAQSGGHQLEKIVFVQAGADPRDALAEVNWVSKLARQNSKIVGIVADAPLEKGKKETEAHIRELSQNQLVKGVRRLIQGEPAGFAIRSDFVDAVRALREFQFSFDICITHDQLEEALELVTQIPDVNFVLDHIGKPDIKKNDQEMFLHWQDHISQLSQRPNVWCKLSGLITEADHQKWTPKELQPYIDHILTQFGSQRVMYGGDWPVSLLASSNWSDWIDVAVASLSGISEDEKRDVFYNNGIRFYRL